MVNALGGVVENAVQEAARSLQDSELLMPTELKRRAKGERLRNFLWCLAPRCSCPAPAGIRIGIC